MEYLMMYRALDEWHICPWIDPITKQEYPEIRYSMFKILEYSNKRMIKDQHEEERKMKTK